MGAASTRLGNRAAFVLKSVVSGGLTIAARVAGLFPEEMFWHIFLGIQAAMIVEHLARTKHLQAVWNRLFSRPFSVLALQVAALVVACAYLIAVAAALSIVAFEFYFGEIPLASHAWLLRLAPVRHGLVLSGLVGSVGLALFLWRSRSGKIDVLDSVGAAITEANNAQKLIDDAADAKAVKAEGTRAVEKLLRPMLEPRGAFRSRTASLRTGFVFLLNGDGRFDAAVMWPPHPEYVDLPQALRPSLWRPAEVGQLQTELAEARRSLKGAALEQKEREIRLRREGCASITGYAFRFPGLHIYPDVSRQFFRTEAYTEVFDPRKRDLLAFKSKAAIRLQCGSRVVGVLVLTDTAVGGFMNSDKSPIELLAPLVAMVVDRVTERLRQLERE